MGPRFREFFSCHFLPLLPGLACSVHATWGLSFSRALYSANDNLMHTNSALIVHPCNELPPSLLPPLTSSISSVTLQTDAAAVDGAGGGGGLADLLLKRMKGLKGTCERFGVLMEDHLNTFRQYGSHSSVNRIIIRSSRLGSLTSRYFL